jgi:lipoprotein LprG
MQLMPFGRRSTAVLLAAITLTASLVAGCSKDEKSSAPLPNAATLLKQSTESTRNLKSAHLELTVQGKVEHLSIKTLSGDLTNTPAVAAKGNTRITLAGGDVDANFVVLDGTLYGSLDPNTWSDFGSASNVYDVSVILNPDKGLANLLANFTDPKADGRETIDGIETVKITGQVSADNVNNIAPKVANGNVPATVWIREDGNHDLVQAEVEPSSGNSIRMTVSKWNEPVTVEKPPGV